MIFLDVEASGLHATSFPVEVAWCSHDFTAAWSTFIRPATIWTSAEWDPQSERIHGIRWETALASGMPIAEAADQLNVDLAGRQVMTDDPAYDFRWLGMLFAACRAEPEFPMLVSSACNSQALITAAAAKARLDAAEHESFAAALNAEAGIVPHRALDDAVAQALSLAAVALLELARDRGDAAAFAGHGEIVARARRLLRQHGRKATS